eukprot:1346193-Amorphochlora_amoeboformis.AAC.1
MEVILHQIQDSARKKEIRGKERRESAGKRAGESAGKRAVKSGKEELARRREISRKNGYDIKAT